jgi:asparagine synthase (glutamine-hydrolysing)
MISSIGYRGPDDSGEFLHYFLRQKLLQEGHMLASQCDSEVVPHLYEEFGVELANELRGMFAFALWDGGERRLLLCRDRLGIKPLYYAVTNDFLVFSSEIKAIIASGLVEPEIDPHSLDDLFSLSYPCPPRSMFKGVYELPPAHFLTAHSGSSQLTKHRYWRSPIPHAGEHRRISRADAADELRSLLKLRVYDHMISDVPVAAYLSGGLDSSAICALFKDVFGDPPETFSISFDVKSHDELGYAQSVAGHLGSTNHVLKCDGAMARDLEAMIWHTELPLQFPLALPLMGFPVVLTGEGADELMGGYDCFRADKMRRLFDRPALRFVLPQIYRQLYKWHDLPDGTVSRMLENQRDSKRIQRSFGGILPPWYDMWTTIGVERERLLGIDGRRVRPVEEAPEGFRDLLPVDLDRLHPLDAALALEQATRLPSWILLLGDRASMAESVEARVPFLDHDVVEFFAALPPSHKMRGFREKDVLRAAVGDMLPPSITKRPKRPFYTPIREWFFASPAREFVDQYLSHHALLDAGLFDPDLVGRFRDQLKVVAPDALLRHQLEWTLLLVLSTQILHAQFVRDRCQRN